MNDWSIILFSLGMIILFVLPFFIISSVKDRQEDHRRQKEK